MAGMTSARSPGGSSAQAPALGWWLLMRPLIIHCASSFWVSSGNPLFFHSDFPLSYVCALDHGNVSRFLSLSQWGSDFPVNQDQVPLPPRFSVLCSSSNTAYLHGAENLISWDFNSLQTILSVQFSSVQLLSRVRLFATS